MGYGGADTSGGSRGGSGSGGAFTGGGLQTGKTWYGTKAHFNGGLQGYSTGGSNFRSPTGQVTNSNFQTPQQGMSGYQPASAPPPPPQYVPPHVPPYVPPPLPPLAQIPAPPMPPPNYTPPPMGPWPGQSAIPPNGPVYSQQRVTQVPKTNFGGGNMMRTYTANQIRKDPGVGGGFGSR